MKPIIDFMESKQFKKLLKNKDFIFCVTAYPIVLIVFIALKIYVSAAEIEDVAVWYTFLSFVALGSLAVISIFERIEKRITYKIQGDKLKLKRAERNWKA